MFASAAAANRDAMRMSNVRAMLKIRPAGLDEARVAVANAPDAKHSVVSYCGFGSLIRFLSPAGGTIRIVDVAAIRGGRVAPVLFRKFRREFAEGASLRPREARPRRRARARRACVRAPSDAACGCGSIAASPRRARHRR